MPRTRSFFPWLIAAAGLLAAPVDEAAAQTATPAAPAAPIEHMAIDDPVTGYVAEAAQRFGLPAEWIRAVIAVESGGDPRARSPKGAMGLMQIMPATWTELRARYALGDDPFEPRANILAGTAYLREMYERYDSPGFLAAYHAGPGRYDDHLVSNRPLPAETRAYLALLAPVVGDGAVATLSAQPPSWTDAPLFVTLAGRASSTDPVQADRHSDDAPAASAVRDFSTILPQSAGLFVARSTPRSLR